MPCLITVAAKSSFVTVFDVLQALYSLLRLRVTTTEPGFVACASQDATVASFRGKDNRFSDRLKLEERLADGVGRVTTKSYQCYVNFDLDQPRRVSHNKHRYDLHEYNNTTPRGHTRKPLNAAPSYTGT